MARKIGSEKKEKVDKEEKGGGKSALLFLFCSLCNGFFSPNSRTPFFFCGHSFLLHCMDERDALAFYGNEVS